MIPGLVLAIALAAAGAEDRLAGATHAIAEGRLDQARLMIAKAIEGGASGAPLERALADLEFASGKDQSALLRYESLLQSGAGDPRLLENAGIAALRLGEPNRAWPLLDRAIAAPGASWRAWNARGVAADHAGDWAMADRAYTRAAQLGPLRAEVANNLGWSYMIRGRWAEAVAALERASALDPASERIAANLDLARMAVTAGLPDRRPGESDGDWAARLNDAGVLAQLQGDRKRAVAAFARALEARSSWYLRAANNLAAAEGR